jgi:CheY-like chemotaxis protein
MSKFRLLVADDSVTIQKVIRLALSNDGYEIHTVSDGHDALQEIALLRPHAVLIDISLPGKNAAEVKEEISDSDDLSQTRFILMSSAFEKVDEEKIQDAGFEGRLIKPFDPSNLREVLQNVLKDISPDSTERQQEGHLDLPPPPPQAIKEAPKENEFFLSPPPPPPALPFNDPPQAPEAIPSPPPFTPPFAMEKLELDSPPPSFPESDFESESESDEPPSLSDDLWNDIKDDELNFPPPPEVKNEKEEDDTEEDEIRKLTESTMKMSGLGDSEWSVNEKGKFKFNEPEEDSQASRNDHQDAPLPLDLSSSYFNAPDEELPSEPPNQIRGVEAEALALTPEQMEEIISSQVQKKIEELARELIPEIAERIIKDEIHRMLENPPE